MLSAILITKNEEVNISRCLDSLKGLVDEIVIVDSGSTDDTLNIAKKYNAKIYYRQFDDFASQRNYSVMKATGDWILSLDADETIDDTLRKEIKINTSKTEFDAFLISRRNIIFGKEIKYSRWSPDKHVWLFKKGKGTFYGAVHEEVKVKGQIGNLSGHKLHYSHKNIHDFLEKMNTYTTSESENKKYVNLGIALFAVARSFVGRYVLKQGFRDGWRGFVLAYLMSIYRLTTFVKQWEKQK
ncbi:glycosyltransferase family 2 protein [Candidatus Microgenomates bacterium]|nr:MAG: glycosyltransferase family 2 protein [Candidatus Microgenomates bacterium]